MKLLIDEDIFKNGESERYPNKDEDMIFLDSKRGEGVEYFIKEVVYIDPRYGFGSNSDMINQLEQDGYSEIYINNDNPDIEAKFSKSVNIGSIEWDDMNMYYSTESMDFWDNMTVNMKELFKSHILDGASMSSLSFFIEHELNEVPESFKKFLNDYIDTKDVEFIDVKKLMKNSLEKIETSQNGIKKREGKIISND